MSVWSAWIICNCIILNVLTDDLPVLSSGMRSEKVMIPLKTAAAQVTHESTTQVSSDQNKPDEISVKQPGFGNQQERSSLSALNNPDPIYISASSKAVDDMIMINKSVENNPELKKIPNNKVPPTNFPNKEVNTSDHKILNINSKEELQKVINSTNLASQPNIKTEQSASEKLSNKSSSVVQPGESSDLVHATKYHGECDVDVTNKNEPAKCNKTVPMKKGETEKPVINTETSVISTEKPVVNIEKSKVNQNGESSGIANDTKYHGECDVDINKKDVSAKCNKTVPIKKDEAKTPFLNQETPVVSTEKSGTNSTIVIDEPAKNQTTKKVEDSAKAVDTSITENANVTPNTDHVANVSSANVGGNLKENKKIEQIRYPSSSQEESSTFRITRNGVTIFIVSLTTLAVFGYVGLIAWKKYMLRRSGRSILINEEEFCEDCAIDPCEIELNQNRNVIV